MSTAERVKILMVDDRPENLLAYRAILGEQELDLVLCESGADALKQLLRHDFAVILLDVNMPGMDGFETANLIRQRKRSARTPIIFVTAFHDDMRAGQGYASGAVDYLSSPIVPEVLKAKVRVFVELFRMHAEIQRQGEERLALAQERNQRAAAEDARQRWEFLSNVSAVLGRSLDDREMARDLARLLVPELGDYAVLARTDSAGQWNVVYSQQNGEVSIEEHPNLDAVPTHLAEKIRTALSHNGPTQLPTPRCDLSCEEPETLVLLLRGQKASQTALGLSRQPTNRSFSTAEVSLADSVGWRAAMAFENARLYKDLELADRQKNEFLSMLAHELRNPLAPIRTAVDLLRMRGSDDPQSCVATDVIDRQSHHLVRLVDELLDVSRITLGKIHLDRQAVDLETLVNSSVETSRPMIDAGQHELTVSIPPERVHLNCDRMRISQVLANLLNNAAKYTPEGGKISLRAECHERDIVFMVQDNGIGIPAEMLSKIFGLFSQVDRSIDRSQGGLGIGLTLVKRLVELHGGSVQASSDGPGLGTLLTVRLPIVADNVDAPADDASGLEPIRNSALRVLVVDDNVDAAKTTAMLLKLNKHHVRMAHNGRVALDEAQGFCPHVVLLDLGLPEIDGYEVARRLRGRAESRETLLVAVSGYGQEEDRRKTTEAGFDLHLVKPVDSAALLRALARARHFVDLAVK